MRQWETACETSQRGFRSSQNLEDTAVPAIGHISHDSDSERPRKVASKKHCFVYSFSDRPKLRSLLANRNDKSSLQEAHWWSSTLATHFWWLDNIRSQSAQRGRWLPKQSPILSHGTRFDHSMDSILSVQNGNFPGDGKESTKIPRAVGNVKSHLHWQVVGIWHILWRLIMI